MWIKCHNWDNNLLESLAYTPFFGFNCTIITPQLVSSIMKNPFNELKDSLMEMESDFQKFFDKGNKAAGTRVRKGLMDLRNRMQDIRKEVQEAKNSAA